MPRLPIRLFNAKRLAQELGRKELCPRVLGYYLAASYLLFIPLAYSGFIYYDNPLWSWLHIYQGFAVTAIIVWGLSAAYFASGGDENPDFITEFICLAVPVFFTTVLIVWSVYWGLFFLGFHYLSMETYRDAVPAIYQLLWKLHFYTDASGAVFNPLSFLAVVSVEVIGFYRIIKLFRIVRAVKSSSQ